MDRKAAALTDQTYKRNRCGAEGKCRIAHRAWKKKTIYVYNLNLFIQQIKGSNLSATSLNSQTWTPGEWLITERCLKLSRKASVEQKSSFGNSCSCCSKVHHNYRAIKASVCSNWGLMIWKHLRLFLNFPKQLMHRSEVDSSASISLSLYRQERYCGETVQNIIPIFISHLTSLDDCRLNSTLLSFLNCQTVFRCGRSTCYRNKLSCWSIPPSSRPHYFSNKALAGRHY